MPNKNIKYLFILCIFQILLTGALCLYLSIFFPSTIVPHGDNVIHKIEKSIDINELKEASKQLLNRIEFSVDCNFIFVRVVFCFIVIMIFLLGLSLILIRNLKNEFSRFYCEEKHNGA